MDFQLAMLPSHLQPYRKVTQLTFLIIQTPSPKPTKTQERPSSRRITYTFVFSVSSTFPQIPLGLSAFALSPAVRLTQQVEISVLTLYLPTERNGRKTLTTVQGLPKKFDQKKILKVIKKKFGKLACLYSRTAVAVETKTNTVGIACNGTIVVDSEMGEVIQLQGDQRKDVQEFLTDKKEGLELDAKTIKVRYPLAMFIQTTN